MANPTFAFTGRTVVVTRTRKRSGPPNGRPARRAFLASEEASSITGAALPADGAISL